VGGGVGADEVGGGVGAGDGCEGVFEGTALGDDGVFEGCAVGFDVTGFAVGTIEGPALGPSDGIPVVGFLLGAVGKIVGCAVG